MARSHKGVGSFVVLAIVVYLLVKYWPTIKAAVAPALAQAGVTPTPGPAPAPTNLRPGDPAYASTFGGSNAQFNGFNAPGFAIRGPDAGGFTGLWGSGGGAIDFSYLAAGNPTIGPIRSAFAPGCSTHLTDGKPLCE